jgi:hypothetical protein
LIAGRQKADIRDVVCFMAQQSKMPGENRRQLRIDEEAQRHLA